ncbi:MAG TPA: hypothetical protein VF599_20860 [Pyrinomonadaceae bacterium]|jgi:hypothetical protein
MQITFNKIVAFCESRIAFFAIFFSLAMTSAAQLPKLPKIERPKPPKVEQTQPVSPNVSSSSATTTAGATVSTEAHLLRRTIQVVPRRFTRWWKNSAAAEPVYDTYSWAPEIKFAVTGPVPAGSRITVEFDDANGKLWFSQKMRTPELNADAWDWVQDVEEMNSDALEKKAITAQTGAFPFRVKIKNALSGTESILFAGKYKISTYVPDQKIPDYKGKREFYIDEDWRLPMGWLWLNAVNNENAPVLNAQIWFRNLDSSEKLESFLFYNGRQISKEIVQRSAETVLTNAIDEQPYRWTLQTFFFSNVRAFNRDTNGAFRDSFFLDKNPGEYEIRILRGGELARSMKFNVGADGKITDNGVVKNNRIGGVRFLLPVKITGAADGKFNPTAWQSDAFYGNQLSGFTPAQ